MSFVSRLLALFALFLAVAPLRAATPAPPEALARMGKGGISLRWEARALGPENGDVFLHLWVVPAGRASDDADGSIVRSSDPIEREEITNGPSLLPSPFVLDLFRRRNNKWERLNSVRFIQDKDIDGIVVRWLEPARRRGPILLLNFGYAHWHTWVVLAFPRSLTGRATVQRFLWGGEGGSSVGVRFDGTDARGLLVVREDIVEESRRETHLYRWNGFEFRDPQARYFVIGASAKTLAGAEAFVRREKLQDTAEIQPSDRYPRLKPGFFVVVLARLRSQAEAEATAKSYRRDGIAAAARAAF